MEQIYKRGCQMLPAGVIRFRRKKSYIEIERERDVSKGPVKILKTFAKAV